MRYNNLEKRFDALTPQWIVSTGRTLLELGDTGGKQKWDLSIPFKGKTVSKARYESGDLVDIDTRVGVPDFVVMSTTAFDRYSSMLERAGNGLTALDPFRHLGCKTGFYIEVHGDRWHSGVFVRGLSREEHENEVREAYASAGAEVLQLWESDINERWEEVCLPQVVNFLEKAKRKIRIPEWELGAVTKVIDLDVCRSLADTEYWRELDGVSRSSVVEKLIQMYETVDFPTPDKHMAISDFNRFCEWAEKETRKPTRFGSSCCKHFVRSVADARVKGRPSLAEVWKDKDLMRKSIEWQLSNASGSHHANRFLSAMCHSGGFRVISNLHPSKVVCWIRKHGKKGGVMLDPCAGWGGRMLAAHAMGMRYLAIDANPVLVGELMRMASVLGIDANVVHGSSSDEELVLKLVGDSKVDLVFTSPPYFDKEDYGDDPSQSLVEFPDKKAWHEKFFGAMVTNCMTVLKKDGVAVFNVPKDLNVEWVRKVVSGVSVKDSDVSIEYARSKGKERLLEFTHGESDGKESIDFVVCRICNRRFSRIGWHLRKTHGVLLADYLKEYPDASTISEEASRIVARSNKVKTCAPYKQRTAFRCPDGKIVKKRDAWERAWHPDVPPEDSILDAKDVKVDEGELGKDYVECEVCNYRGKNLTRHLRSKHGIEPDDYTGQIKSEKCLEALALGALKTWDKRGRTEKKEKKDKSDNKTHKVNNLDEKELCRLYLDEGLSDAKIGVLFEMTGEGVAYRRKKWGIKTRKRTTPVRDGMLTIPVISSEHGIPERTIAGWLDGVDFIREGRTKYFSKEDVDAVLSKRCPNPLKHIGSDELMKIMGKSNLRQVACWFWDRGICPVMRFENLGYFDRDLVMDAWEKKIPIVKKR